MVLFKTFICDIRCLKAELNRAYTPKMSLTLASMKNTQ